MERGAPTAEIARAIYDGAVAGLVLEQGGQVLRGARQPAVSP